MLYAAVAMATVVGGCGGGNVQGGASGASVVRPFIAFDQVRPGDTIEANGISQSANATVDESGAVVSLTVNPTDNQSRVRLSYGEGMQLSRVAGSTLHSETDWSGSGQIACEAIACDTVNDRAAGLLANAPELGWNYQSFGYWVESAGSTSAVIDAVTLGSATDFNAMPVSGTANYSGLAAGTYVDATGWPSDYAASMAATVDFGAARSVSFSTTRSLILPLGSEDVIAAPELNLAGTLSISPSANGFSGAVSTTGPSVNLTGTLTGRFYGPNAEEMGGVFALTGSGTEGLLGGFGAKRLP
jgi:hypothetical protein